MKQKAKDLVAENRQQERDEGMNHSKKKCKALTGKMGAESNLKKDGGPFIPVHGVQTRESWESGTSGNWGGQGLSDTFAHFGAGEK